MKAFGRTAMILACAGLLGLVPAAASATPGQGVTATDLSSGLAEDGVVVKARGARDVTVRVITIEPGGYTGWHYHDGPVIANVTEGTLTRTVVGRNGRCHDEVTTEGHSFVEPAAPDHVHIGRNLGSTPVVLHATYVLPAGSPVSQDAPDPGC